MSDPPPWMSVLDIALITDLLKAFPVKKGNNRGRKPRCFEWGSGGSTLRFQDLAEVWISIEHDYEWYRKIKERAMVFLIEDPWEYVHAIGDKPYDFVLVDGRFRIECMKVACTIPGTGHTVAPLVACHDAHRTEYLMGTVVYPWKIKAGDDLLLMSMTKPCGSVLKVLNNPLYQARDVTEGSNPWDLIHPSEKAPFCGFQEPKPKDILEDDAEKSDNTDHDGSASRGSAPEEPEGKNRESGMETGKSVQDPDEAAESPAVPSECNPEKNP